MSSSRNENKNDLDPAAESKPEADLRNNVREFFSTEDKLIKSMQKYINDFESVKNKLTTKERQQFENILAPYRVYAGFPTLGADEKTVQIELDKLTQGSANTIINKVNDFMNNDNVEKRNNAFRAATLNYMDTTKLLASIKDTHAKEIKNDSQLKNFIDATPNFLSQLFQRETRYLLMLAEMAKNYGKLPNDKKNADITISLDTSINKVKEHAAGTNKQDLIHEIRKDLNNQAEDLNKKMNSSRAKMSSSYKQKISGELDTLKTVLAGIDIPNNDLNTTKAYLELAKNAIHRTNGKRTLETLLDDKITILDNKIQSLNTNNDAKINNIDTKNHTLESYHQDNLIKFHTNLNTSHSKRPEEKISSDTLLDNFKAKRLDPAISPPRIVADDELIQSEIKQMLDDNQTEFDVIDFKAEEVELNEIHVFSHENLTPTDKPEIKSAKTEQILEGNLIAEYFDDIDEQFVAEEVNLDEKLPLEVILEGMDEDEDEDEDEIQFQIEYQAYLAQNQIASDVAEQYENNVTSEKTQQSTIKLGPSR